MHARSLSSLARSGRTIIPLVAAMLLAMAPVGTAVAQSSDLTALINAAKQEGSVRLYSGFTESDNATASALFQKKYGIPVEVFTGDTTPVVARFEMEAKAGRVAVDVLALSDVFVSSDLQKQGLLMQYRPPATLEPGFDPRFAGSYYQDVGFTIWPAAWNSKLVTGANVPKDFDAFITPFWKGRLGMLDASTTMIGLQQYYLLRTAMGVDYMRKLGAQGFLFISPNTAIAERVSSGEIYGAPFMILNVVTTLMHQGAPLAMGYMTTGTPVLLRTLQITKAAPHPNAAKLFVNFLLSQEGQEQFQAEARAVSPRTDVTIKDLPSLTQVKTLTIADVDAFASKEADLRKEFEQFFKGH